VAEYQTHCCVLECFAAILSPLFRRLLIQHGSQGESDAHVVLSREDWGAVGGACLAVVRAVLAGSAQSPAELLDGCPEQQDAARHEPLLLAPYVSCLVAHTPVCVGQELLSQGEQKFALFSLYLQEHAAQWKQLGADDKGRLAMLRGLKRVLEHDLAMGTVIALKEAVVSVLQRCLLDMQIIREADSLAQPATEVAKLLKSIP